MFRLYRPTHPEIIINPQMWGSSCLAEASEFCGSWFYNYRAAKLESKFLGKKIPTKDEWNQIIKSGWRPDKLEGCCDPIFGLFHSQGKYGLHWSSTQYSDYYYGAYFSENDGIISNNLCKQDGFVVYCLED